MSFLDEDQLDRGEPVSSSSHDSNESPVHQTMNETGHHHERQQTADQHQLSSLELENKLLKNEVASLNQEMTSALNRAKKAQHGKEYSLKGTFRDHRVTGAPNFQQIRDFCMFTSVLYVLTY